MDYNESDFLQLSGIQHFLFCRRQWALIHIENQWVENYRTVDGELMHQNAHDPFSHTRRGEALAVRAMQVHSARFGISGECDVVEFHASLEGVPLARTEGLWLPYPIEYKRGSQKTGNYDEAQLCAQALCLEEMFCCEIQQGALYYGAEHHRCEVEFTPELRRQVTEAVAEMHRMRQRGMTPKAKPNKGCNACSLKDICLPRLMKTESVNAYLHRALTEENI